MKEKIVLTPAKIGKVEIKNRVIFPSMCTFFCDAAGFVSEDQISLVRSLAEGGTGMIVVPGSPHGRPGPGRPALSDDKYIPGWKIMADIVHKSGAKLFCQLHPAAVQAGRDKVVKRVEDYDIPLIEMIRESYAAEAERCMKAGVDGVEIHGAHAHEIAQFMSPHYNHRSDEYGGDYRARAKYSVEIVKAIKARCGKDYPVIFRISSDELVEGGRTLPETIEIIKLLIEAGIDAVHVSIGMPESEEFMCAPMDVEDCFNVDSAAAVKEAIGGVIPVITVGRISTLDEAEEVLQAGKADFTAIGRAQLADHAIVNKYSGLNDDPVCRCVGCNQGCRDATVRKKIRCMQNAYVGYEGECTVAALADGVADKKIAIIGAGPAGLQTAMVLAQHGVKPIVYEKSAAPGGLISLASKPPFKAAMDRVTDYRVAMLQKYGVEIRCNTEVTIDFLKAEQPDIVVLATGSVPLIPKIPGIDGENVYTGDQIISDKPAIGERIAIIGGGLIGCEVAELLMSEGKQVVMFEMLSDIATELTFSRRVFMLKRLEEKGLKVHTKAIVEKITPTSVTARIANESRVFDDFDDIVVAAGRSPEQALLQRAQELPTDMRVLVAGDASKPALAIDAIRNATGIAMQILKGNI